MRGRKWELKSRDRSPFLYAVFYLPGAGDKAVWRSTGTGDPREAEVRAGEIWVQAMRKAGQPVALEVAAQARVTVETAVAGCIVELERLAGEHRDQFVRRHREDLKLYVMPKSQDAVARGLYQPPWRYVDEITSEAWERVKRELHKGNGGPLGWNSIRHLCVSLRKLLHHARDVGALENVPELAPPPHKLIRQEAASRRAYSLKEREAFLLAIAKRFPKSHRFYTVLFFSLLRKGELFALTPRWIDFKGGHLRLPPRDSKKHEIEEVDLHPRAAKALRAQLAERKADERDPDKPLFGQHDCRKAFEFGIAKAKIDRSGLVPHHSTRHTGATMVGEQAKDIAEVMAAMRVSSIAIAQRYMHVDARRARRVMRKL